MGSYPPSLRRVKNERVKGEEEKVRKAVQVSKGRASLLVTIGDCQVQQYNNKQLICGEQRGPGREPRTLPCAGYTTLLEMLPFTVPSDKWEVPSHTPMREIVIQAAGLVWSGLCMKGPHIKCLVE